MSKALRWAGLVVIALAGICLGSMWDRVPDSWPVHWGVRMQPDRWAQKTVIEASSPLLLGLLLWIVNEALARFTERTAKIPALGRATADLLRAAGFAASSLCATVAVVLPLVRPLHPVLLVTLGAGGILGVVAIGALHIRRVVRDLKRDGTHGLEGHDGLVYRNRADPRLWVPKLSGMGYTINFSHRYSLLVLALLLVPPLALAVAFASFSR